MPVVIRVRFYDQGHAQGYEEAFEEDAVGDGWARELAHEWVTSGPGGGFGRTAMVERVELNEEGDQR